MGAVCFPGADVPHRCPAHPPSGQQLGAISHASCTPGSSPAIPSYHLSDASPPKPHSKYIPAGSMKGTSFSHPPGKPGRRHRQAKTARTNSGHRLPSFHAPRHQIRCPSTPEHPKSAAGRHANASHEIVASVTGNEWQGVAWHLDKVTPSGKLENAAKVLHVLGSEWSVC